MWRTASIIDDGSPPKMSSLGRPAHLKASDGRAPSAVSSPINGFSVSASSQRLNVPTGSLKRAASCQKVIGSDNTNGSTPSFRVIGTRPIRHDGADKVTGRAKYGADYALPGMLHGKILRSPHAHARIKKINTAEALGSGSLWPRHWFDLDHHSFIVVLNLYSGKLPEEGVWLNWAWATGAPGTPDKRIEQR